MSFLAALLGDKPFKEKAPLTHGAYQKLWQTRPALVDYLPYVDFNPQEQLFQFDDGFSCGAVFKLRAPDMEARSSEMLEEFTGKLGTLIRNAPRDDDYPYIVQVYLEDREPENIADQLYRATPLHIRDTPFSQAWFDAMRVHFDMMSAPEGIFPDSRTNNSKGWRALERRVTLCIYRIAPEKVWKADKRMTPMQLFNKSIRGFEQGMINMGMQPERLNNNGLRNWLLPWFTPNPAGKPDDMRLMQWLAQNPIPEAEADQGAAWDLAQTIMEEPPKPINEDDAKRGILKFGDVYSRFVTLQGVMQAPKAGSITTDYYTNDRIIASLWDHMPAQSIFSWTWVPMPHHVMEARLNKIEVDAQNAGSRYGQEAKIQVNDAHNAIINKSDEIYYFQAGVYLFADSIEHLDDKFYQALSLIDNYGAQRPIKEEHDLFPTDSYVRNLPMVFSWQHDRKHAKRCTMTYVSHIAASSPFFGRGAGSENPCFISYNRAGELFKINPYHKADRARTAHMLLFGPTGAGKSATVVNLAAQSMAVNRPRQFFIDKGGSFAPLCDYYESLGLKVRRIVFSPQQDVCYPPYAETRKALAQFRGEFEQKSQDDPNQDIDEEDKRDYIAEMMSSTLLMITGGNQQEMDAIDKSKESRLQSALRLALEQSEANDQPHARPIDVMNALIAMSDKEPMPQIAYELRNVADAMKLWTEGSRGHFFNRFGASFSDTDDVTLIEMGVLTSTANQDMLAVAMMSILSNITALGEAHQYGNRHGELWIDEAHYITKNNLLVGGAVEAVKVWRKLGLWLNLITQNTEDFPAQANASRLLQLIEFWWLLQMPAKEVNEINNIKQLSDEEKTMMLQCKKEPPYFVECVFLSGKYPPTLLRQVPPALSLALGMTEQHEKLERREIMKEFGCTEVEAVLIVADRIIAKRKSFAPGLL